MTDRGPAWLAGTALWDNVRMGRLMWWFGLFVCPVAAVVLIVMLLAGKTAARPAGPGDAALMAALPGPGDVPAGWTPAHGAGARFTRPAYRSAPAVAHAEFTAPALGGGPVAFTLKAQRSSSAAALPVSGRLWGGENVVFPGADQAVAYTSCEIDGECSTELMLVVGRVDALVSVEARNHPLDRSVLDGVARTQVERLREAEAGRRPTARAR